MTNEEWSTTLVTRVSGEVRRQRKRVGMSTEALAKACSNLGVPIAANTITNFETGRRVSLKLEELLAYAHALRIPLVSLLFPLDGPQEVSVLPDLVLSTWEAVQWACGAEQLPGSAAEGSPRELLDAFREHEALVRTAMVSFDLSAERRRAATQTLDVTRASELASDATQFELIFQRDCRALAASRGALHGRGLVPPKLPEALAFVDSQPLTES